MRCSLYMDWRKDRKSIAKTGKAPESITSQLQGGQGISMHDATFNFDYHAQGSGRDAMQSLESAYKSALRALPNKRRYFPTST